MSKLLLGMVCLLLPISLFAQDDVYKTGSYIQVYGGLGMQGSSKTKQTGVAYRRGNYNVFDTDFDLLVKLNGKTDVSSYYSTGVVFGHSFIKKDRLFNPGFEIDLSWANGKQTGTLVNKLDQQVNNINGPNRAQVLALIEEEYGAGHHSFYNEMDMSALNVAANFIVSTKINKMMQAYGGIGLGLSGVTLSDAQSLQTSPANAAVGYETTTDNGGGLVTHFNSGPKAKDNLTFFQARFGAKAMITDHISFLIDMRAYYRGKADFTFGSTRYSDHAPTSNWDYRMNNNKGIMLSAGLNFTL
jgi:opacity protein-like surface antigen